MIDHKNKILFIHVPKCAGSSIKIWMKHISGKCFQKGGHPTYDYYSKKYNVQDYYKFTMVRNPYDRVVSAYCYLKKGGRGSRHDVAARDELKDCTFLQFAKKIDHFKQKYIHFREQMYFIKDVSNYDVIGRVENVEQLINTLRRDLNITHDDQIPNVNMTGHQQYKSYYDDEIYDIISHAYKNDLTTLNYEY